MKKTISDKKKDYSGTEWKAERFAVLKRDNNKCKVCGSNVKLHCHHNYYVAGRFLWDYPLMCFRTLCEECHTAFHKKTPGYKLVIWRKDKIREKENFELKHGFDAGLCVKAPVKKYVPQKKLSKRKKQNIKEKKFLSKFKTVYKK